MKQLVRDCDNELAEMNTWIESYQRDERREVSVRIETQQAEGSALAARESIRSQAKADSRSCEKSGRLFWLRAAGQFLWLPSPPDRDSSIPMGREFRWQQFSTTRTPAFTMNSIAAGRAASRKRGGGKLSTAGSCRLAGQRQSRRAFSRALQVSEDEQDGVIERLLAIEQACASQEELWLQMNEEMLTWRLRAGRAEACLSQNHRWRNQAPACDSSLPVEVIPQPH